MKTAIMIALTLAGPATAFAAESAPAAPVETQKLYCRLSTNFKNYDFETPGVALEAAPFGMGGRVTSTDVPMKTENGDFKVTFTYVDLNGSSLGAKQEKKSVSIGFQKAVDPNGPDSLLPYALKVAATANLADFMTSPIDISVSSDTTPLGFDGKVNLWCATAKMY